VTKSFAQLNAEIQRLAERAEAARLREVDGVIQRIQEAIAAYGLTAADLGFAKTAKGRDDRLKPKRPKVQAAYRDGQGNVWTGRGARPAWLRQALAKGKSLEEFAVAKRGGMIKFRDEHGNTWSGFGPKPAWLKAAMAAGKSLEDFAV
jgi:DNA-binding protein H-NS